jgi:predicted Ser/Thr protein kinase
MLSAFPDGFERRLHAWILSSLASGENVLSGGYQGTVLYYEDDAVRLVIKAPPRSAWQRPILLPLLRHEYRVYRKLEGFSGIPRCHGFIDNRFLVLEFIEGASLRAARIGDHAGFFEGLRTLLERLHACGIAHADLKKKDNILVGANGRPYLVDFGVACLRKPGFAPVNRWLFDTAVRFDRNAWIKHKYRRRYDEIGAADRTWLRPTLIERISRLVKQPYRAVKRGIRRSFKKK